MAESEQSNNNNTIETLLRNCRIDAGLTQRELAKEIGVHHSLISKYEKGRIPSQQVARLVVNALSRSKASKNKLNQLQNKLTHELGEITNQHIHPSLARISLRFQHFTNDEAEFAGDALETHFSIIVDRLQAEKLDEEKKWPLASSRLDAALQLLEDSFSKLRWVLYAKHAATSYREGKFDEAIQYGEWARAMSVTGTLELDKGDEAANLLTLGLAYRRRAKWESAKEAFESIKKLLNGDPHTVADCDRKIISLYNFQGQCDEAILACEQVENFLKEKELENTEAHFKLLRHKAWALNLKGGWQEAEELYKEANRLLEEIDMPDMDRELERVRGARYLADAYSLRSERQEEALKLYRENIKSLDTLEAEGKNIPLLKAMNLLGLGQILANRLAREKELSPAAYYLGESEKLFSKFRETRGVALANIAIGKLHAKTGGFNNAEKILLVALESAHEVKEQYFIGEALSNLIETYFLWGRLESVHEKYKDIQKEAKQIYDIHLSKIQSLVGRAYIYDGQSETGADWLCRSTLTGLNYNLYTFKDRFGELIAQINDFISEKQFDKAHDLLQRCDDFWKGQMPRLHLPKETLSEVQETLSNLDKKRLEITRKKVTI